MPWLAEGREDMWEGGGKQRGRSRRGEFILSAPLETTKQTVTPLIQPSCFGKNMTFCLAGKQCGTCSKNPGQLILC